MLTGFWLYSDVALLMLLRWKILHNAQMLLTPASNISVQGQQAAQHRSSGVSPKERVGDLHELFSLSNILCGKLTNLAWAGAVPVPYSQMSMEEEVHKINHMLIILCNTLSEKPGLKSVRFAWPLIFSSHQYDPMFNDNPVSHCNSVTVYHYKSVTFQGTFTIYI